jgi:hypothetical protein
MAGRAVWVPDTNASGRRIMLFLLFGSVVGSRPRVRVLRMTAQTPEAMRCGRLQRLKP